MSAWAGRGAVVGFVAGLAVDVLLFLPQILTGEGYEIENAMIYMGLPVLAVSTGVGLLAGLVLPRDRSGGVTQDGTATGTVGGALGALVLVTAGVVAFLYATGRFG